jgi:hypothetical protein
LFDSNLQVRNRIEVQAGSRYFLLDLSRIPHPEPKVLASACKALPAGLGSGNLTWTIEGVGGTPSVVLLALPRGSPREVKLDGVPVDHSQLSSSGPLLWVRFVNKSIPRQLTLSY